jgi:hypothetical protein
MSDLPPIQVTNNTSGTIELFDVYQKTTGEKAPTETTPVTYTSLGTVKPGETGTIKILHSSNHIVAMQTGPLADPTGGTQADFPVKVIAVFSFGDDRSFTVKKEDKDAMEQTFRFIRYVSANPGSVLATAFLAALNQENQTEAVNAFFAGSASFSSCTMVTWSAVTAWQSDFLSAWQGSYYLYDASKDLKAMKLVAGVSVALSGDDVQAQLWMADADGKWTLDSAHTALAIAVGHVSEANTTPGMSVNLQPVWMNAVQSAATKDASATSVIAPAMSGTVNGTKVLGNFKKMPTPAAGSAASSNAVAAWLKQNVNVGVLVSAGMLYIMYKQWQESKNTKADEVVKNEQAEGVNEDAIVKDVSKSGEVVESAAHTSMEQIQDRCARESEDFANSEADARLAQARVDVQDVASQQQDALQDVLEEAPASPATDDLVSSLESAIDKADAGDLDGAWTDLSKAGTHLQKLMAESEDRFSKEAQDDAKVVEEDIKSSAEQADAERQAEREQQDNSDKGSEDTVGDDDVTNADPPEMDFPVGE